MPRIIHLMFGKVSKLCSGIRVAGAGLRASGNICAASLMEGCVTNSKTLQVKAFQQVSTSFPHWEYFAE